ncbi:MAG: PEP-CTERM sorting domain-containing protein [Limisphaerales bacterium]
MKTYLNSNTLSSNRKSYSLCIAIVAAGMLSAANSKADVVFDNFSSGQSANSTSSTPNTFMGDGYTLATGTTAITGFDLYPVNVTGTSYTGLRATIYLWGTVNTGAVSAATPAFSNLLGTYTFNFTDAYTTGFYFPLVGATPGTPGAALASPVAISSPTVGITLNYQGTTDGVNYSTVNNLTSIISTGATAPSVGSAVFNGYYRNGNGEVNGNFTSGVRSLGLQNQSLALRIYGNVTPVPEPTSLALIGAGGLALLALRRRA